MNVVNLTWNVTYAEVEIDPAIIDLLGNLLFCFNVSAVKRVHYVNSSLDMLNTMCKMSFLAVLV